MTEPDLTFISRQLERVLAGQRDMGHELEIVQRDLVSIKNEMQIMRAEIRIMAAKLDRLDDIIRHDVLDRLQALEHAK